MQSHRLLLLLALASAASAQSVVSVRSGLINFSDGAVFVDGQQLEQQPGKFREIKEGAELSTQVGRAEILLTPGVFLRIGDHSSIRMVSNRFRDTRVEFQRGSAILESNSPSPDTAVTLIIPDILYGDFQVRFMKDGRYRLDSLPPDLRVTTGEAEVVVNGKSVIVGEAHRLRLNMPLVAQKFENDLGDRLDGWSDARSEAIAAGSAQVADSADISSVVDGWQGNPDPYAAYVPPRGLTSYSQLPPYSPLYGSSLGIGAPYPYGAWGVGIPVYVPLYRYSRPGTLGYRPPGGIGYGTAGYGTAGYRAPGSIGYVPPGGVGYRPPGTLGSRMPGTLGGSSPGLGTPRPATPGLSTPRPAGVAHPVGIGRR